MPEENTPLVQEENNSLTRATQALVFFTAIMAFVSGILALYTYRLYTIAAGDSVASGIRDSLSYSVSKKNLDLAKTQFDSAQTNTRKSLAISDSLLYANKEYTRIFKEAAETENRAYIAIGPVGPIVFGIGYYKDSLPIKNVGKTPAYVVIVRHEYIFDISEKAVLKDSIFWKKIKRKMNDTMEVTLGSGESYAPNTTMRNFVSRDRYNDFLNQKVNIYVAINTTYKDIFRRPHYTHAFWELHFNGFGVSDRPGSEYNDSN